MGADISKNRITEITGDTVQARKTLKELQGILESKTNGWQLTIEEINKTIVDAVVERNKPPSKRP